jgi:hypothetical protein
MNINGIDLGTYDINSSKANIISTINQYKDNRGIFSRLFFPYTGFEVISSKGKLKIIEKQNNIKMRIIPKFTSGIFYYAELLFIDENINSCKVNFKVSIGNSLLILLLIITFVFPIIFTPLILTTDHYYQTVNGISTTVQGRPYFVYVILGVFISIWWTVVLYLLNKYKKRYMDFIKIHFNVKNRENP